MKRGRNLYDKITIKNGNKSHKVNVIFNFKGVNRYFVLISLRDMTHILGYRSSDSAAISCEDKGYTPLISIRIANTFTPDKFTTPINIYRLVKFRNKKSVTSFIKK